MLTCIKNWELGDARAQHKVEKGMQELEDAANKLMEDGEVKLVILNKYLAYCPTTTINKFIFY
jgi:hypothetical protein